MTKGDNNDTVDLSPVTRAQIVGIQRWRVPYYGYLSEFMRTPTGIISLVIVPGVLLIAMEIRKIVLMVLEEEKAKQVEKTSADAQPHS